MENLVKKIFVVDDDEMLSMALEDYLSRNSAYEVQLFNTGEECLSHLNEQPDIIILDYNLNSVNRDAANGLIILEAIKKMNAGIKIIMLSSQDATWLILQTIKLGASEYVVKDENAFEKIAMFCETSLS
jgi:two-component system, OmpR family, response regulator